MSGFFQPEPAIVLGTLSLFSFLAFRSGALSTGGVVLADAIGIASFYLGGLVSFAALAVFYALAEAATRLARKTGKQHEQRTASNVFGNAGPAIAALILGQPLAFFGAVAAAFSDTVSSEIGMLSQKKPVLITTLREVEKVTDGGITWLGLAAAVLAGTIIAGTYFFGAKPSINGFLVIVLCGVMGSIIDSLLGATLERKGILGNSHVNFFASLSGAVIAFALSGFAA